MQLFIPHYHTATHTSLSHSYTYIIITQPLIPHYHTATHTTLSHSHTYLIITQPHIPHYHTATHTSLSHSHTYLIITLPHIFHYHTATHTSLSHSYAYLIITQPHIPHYHISTHTSLSHSHTYLIIIFGYCLFIDLFIFFFNCSLIDDRSLLSLYFNKKLLTYLLTHSCTNHCHKATYTMLSHNNTFLYINVYSIVVQLHMPCCHTTSHSYTYHIATQLYIHCYHTTTHFYTYPDFTLLHILWYHTFLHIQRCHTCNYTLPYRKYPSTWLHYTSTDQLNLRQ